MKWMDECLKVAYFSLWKKKDTKSKQIGSLRRLRCFKIGLTLKSQFIWSQYTHKSSHFFKGSANLIAFQSIDQLLQKSSLAKNEEFQFFRSQCVGGRAAASEWE